MVNRLLKILGGLAVLLILFIVGILVYVQVNQADLIKQVKAKLDKNIKGELSIHKVQLSLLNDFPRIALTLRGMSVKDSVYGKEIFAADKIYLRMNLIQLFRKQVDFSSIQVVDAKFFLLRDSTGYLNADILRYKPNGDGPNMDFNMKELDIRNLQFIFHEEQRGQHMSFTIVELKGKTQGGGLLPIMHLNGSMQIDSMMFKKDKGAFFKNQLAGLDLNVSIDNAKKQFVIHPSKFEMNKQFYDGSGYFDFSTPQGLLHLEFTNPKADFNAAKGILSDVILGYMKGIELKDSVDVKVLVHGGVQPDFPPEVDATFNLNNASMTYSGIHFTNLTLKGLFMNHVAPGVKNDDHNSALKFDVASVKVEGVPLTANVVITDLIALRIALSAACKTPLTAINQALPKGGYKLTAGDLDLALTYNGVLSAYLPATQRKGEDTLTGYLKITNGGFAYNVRGIQLTNLNSDIAFDQLKMEIKDLSAALNGNQISVKGYVDGVTRMMNNKNQKMTGNLVLDAPVFNLSSVLTEKSLSQINATPKDTSGPASTAAADAIDQLLDDVVLRLNFTSNRFTFRKFVAQKVRGEATISTQGMALKDFNLNTCKGSITVNGGLMTGGKGYDKLAGKVQIKNVNMKEFMLNADNFYQTAVTADNINGNFSANVNFSSPIDTSYTPILDSMKGDFVFSLMGGKISNFEPLANVGKYIFKNRDFNNVTFDEIKDTITLVGTDLTIQRMEIASNVLRMFIQGTYKVNGKADLTIQVPWNNFKKQDVNYTPENIGITAKTGSSLFLRVQGGGKEKIKIGLDAGAKNRLKKQGLM